MCCMDVCPQKSNDPDTSSALLGYGEKGFHEWKDAWVLDRYRDVLIKNKIFCTDNYPES